MTYDKYRAEEVCVSSVEVRMEGGFGKLFNLSYFHKS